MKAAAKSLRIGFALVIGLSFASPSSHAQDVLQGLAQSLGNGSGSGASDSLTQEILRSLTQRGAAGGSQLQPNVQIQNPQGFTQGIPAVPGNTLQGPQPPTANTNGLSPLEKLMSLRANQRLQLYGYDLFGHGGSVIVRQSGALQDNYVLGQGDEIVVTYRGQQSANYRTLVDRDGRVVLPGLPPVPAAGRSFGAFRGDLEAAIVRAFVGTQVTVSVGQVRQISVRLAGEVNLPGAYSLSGLSTVLDAINLAGGIRRTGSLRAIQIVRNGRILHLDLYDMLTGRSPDADLTLSEGDRIVVPLLTGVVAVAGQVRRPAIYELAPGQSGTHIAELLALAGGPQVRGAYRFSLQKTRDDGRRELVQVNPESDTLVHDGDALFVSSSVDSSVAKIELMGSTGSQGYFPLGSAPSLHALFKSADMFAPQSGKPLPYMLVAAIIRLDPQSMQRSVIPFSPVDVLGGKSDMPLQSNDVIYVLNIAEMRYIAKRASDAATLEAESDTENRDSAKHPDNAPVGGAVDQPPASALQSGSASGIFPAQRDPVPPAPVAAPPPVANPYAMQGLPPGLQGSYPYSLYPGGGLGNLPSAYAATDDADLPPLSGIRAPDDDNAADDASNRETAAATQLGFPAGTVRPGGSVYAFGQRLPGQNRAVRTPELRLFVGLDDDERQLLVNTLNNYYVLVSGEVTNPGAFLALSGVGLDKIVLAAGGITPNVDLSGFEISSADIDNRSGTSRTVRNNYKLAANQFAQVSLKPLDRIRFNRIYSDNSGEAAVYGEVRFPGSYEITRGEHLSSLLARSGGMTPAAYPYGAIFLRRSVAEQERGVLQREADMMESQLVGLMGTLTIAKAQVSDGEVAYINQLTSKLRAADGPGGRVAVQIDPKEIAAHPELDVVLEPGDRIFIPRKPNSVVVAGEVMSPSGLQFQEGMSVSDYIARAGGATDVADEGHTFVIQPDGSAVQETGSWLGLSPKLAPGSVIVVPRNLRPFDWNTVLENVIQLTSQLAITAASISVIAN